MDLFKDLLLASYSIFLLLYKPILNTLDLSSDRVQVVIVILDSIFSLFIYHCLKLIHPLMVGGPLSPNECALFIDLMFEVITEGIESVHEIQLKRIQGTVHKVHLLHRMLTVCCYVTKGNSYDNYVCSYA